MIASFSALRFINALMIFCHHKNSIDNPYLVAFGPCAVSFFLMLSGFVMCCGYKEKVIAPEFCYKKFLLKRFARLYPLHLLCLVLWLGLNIKSLVSWGGVQIFSVICNLFLVQSWIPKSSVYFSGNSVSWCLSDLFFFYAVFPFVIKLIQNKKRMVAFTTIYFGLYSLICAFVPKDYIHAFIYINPLFRFADFFIGILLYTLYKKESGLEKRKLFGTCLQIISLLVVCFAIYIYQFVPESLHFQALFFIPSALIVMSYAIFNKTLVTMLLDNRYFFYLGEISFTFYMLHTLGIAFVNIVVSHLGLELAFVNIVVSHLGLELAFVYKSLLEFLFVLVGSVIVHRFYEKILAKKLLMLFDM